jgi:hypothetical protein
LFSWLAHIVQCIGGIYPKLKEFLMNISNVGQILPTPSMQNGKNVPHQTISKSVSSDESSVLYKTVDMRNVSLSEINQLIRSGVDGLLDVVPFVSPSIINQYGPEYAANVKVDFLGQIESSIEFKNSRGEDTAFMEKVLENIKNIDGAKMPLKVDATV